MRGILSSYRWRRRLAWGGGALLLVGGFVVAATVFIQNQAPHAPPAPTGTEAAQTNAEPVKQVRVTPAERRAVNETLVAFIRTAVTRSDPAAAWNLVTPAMRNGISRRDWNKGEVPVTPFPAAVPARPEWNVITSYPGDLTIDFLVQPRKGATQGAIAFAIEFKQHGSRWLMDSMVPEHVFSGGPPATAAPTAKLPANVKAPGLHARLSPLWFIVPGGLLGLIVLVPLLFAINSWRRSRAIARRYRQGRGD